MSGCALTGPQTHPQHPAHHSQLPCGCIFGSEHLLRSTDGDTAHSVLPGPPFKGSLSSVHCPGTMSNIASDQGTQQESETQAVEAHPTLPSPQNSGPFLQAQSGPCGELAFCGDRSPAIKVRLYSGSLKVWPLDQEDQHHVQTC